MKTSIVKMKHKVSKILSNSILAKFVTKKWIKVKSLPTGQYTLNKNIGFFCDYNDAYIVVKGTITVEGDKYDKTRNKKLILDYAYQQSITHL